MGLVLWDVDGTLVRTRGLGSLAFFLAFEEVIGHRPAEEARIHMAGMTDPQIALEMLRRMDVADPAAVLPDVMAALARALAGLEGRIAAEGLVLPGVPEAITALSACPDVAQTLLTGNIVANARVKLGALGLGEGIEFDLGAYGDDHHDRDALVPIALARLAEAGKAADPSRSWVVGDTPRDLACARAGGVQCLLVATGDYTVEDLGSLGADAVMADLSDTDAVVGLLAGTR
jgi:phosphoglycolate phosphatase-like HAD superfamily hydrolase